MRTVGTNPLKSARTRLAASAGGVLAELVKCSLKWGNLSIARNRLALQASAQSDGDADARTSWKYY